MSEHDQTLNSVGSVSSIEANWDARPNSMTETRLMSQEGVFQLTKDLRKFSEALTALKAVFLDEKEKSMKVLAHEQLGELLQVLKMVVGKYEELKSEEILSMASVLIRHVKDYEYEDDQTDMSPEIFRAINNLAMAFSNSVSECLMGDMHVNPKLAMNTSQSFENSDTPDNGLSNFPEAPEPALATSSPSEDTIPPALENVDSVLQNMDSGLEMAFDRAKLLSKYLNELLTYVKKKAVLEMEHAKSLLKLCQATKPILSEQSFLPFQSLYCTALDHDRDYASTCQSMYQNVLLQNKFIDPMTAKKNEHDKKRKQIREAWVKEKRRSEEAILNMKKAKQQYQARVQEYQKAKEAAIRAEGEQLNQQHQQSQTHRYGTGMLYQSTAGKMEKKKKLEEDTNLKASQAELNYKAFVNEANKRLRELGKNKIVYLQQLRELTVQCDVTAKAVTIAYFQLHHQLFAPLPVQFQAMCEDAKVYEPGYQYSDYIRNLPAPAQNERLEFRFEPCTTEGSPYLVNTGKGSVEEMPSHPSRYHEFRRRSKVVSDTGSSSSHSIDEVSPSASPGDLTRSRDFSGHGRRPSTEGSMSSEEILDEPNKETTVSTLPLPIDPLAIGSGQTPDSSPVALRHQISRQAAKVASNVRDAFKVSKKAPKPAVFGVDFSIVAQDTADGIPYIVKRCVAEIDNRALTTKGVYRINGVKNRVEKIRVLFENPSVNVDLTQYSPHDVSGVLKYFLRQLPEPLLQFNLYHEFLKIAKDYQQLIADTNEAARCATEEGRPHPAPPTRQELDSFVIRIRDTVDKLPLPNHNTLQYIISHLTRISSHSKDNKMTASNLAIVFGPTLLRKILIDGNESLNMLMDMPFQSRIIEMLIEHKDFIFGTHSHQAGNIFPFPGFQQAPSSFSAENVDENALTPDSAISEPEDLSSVADFDAPTSTDGISHEGNVLLDFSDTPDSSNAPPPLAAGGSTPSDFLPSSAPLNEPRTILRHSASVSLPGFPEQRPLVHTDLPINDVYFREKSDVGLYDFAGTRRRPSELGLRNQRRASDVSSSNGALIDLSPKSSGIFTDSPDPPSTPTSPRDFATLERDAAVPGVPPRIKTRKHRKSVEEAEQMFRSGAHMAGNLWNKSFSSITAKLSDKRRPPMRKSLSADELEESISQMRPSGSSSEGSRRKLPSVPANVTGPVRLIGHTPPQPLQGQFGKANLSLTRNAQLPVPPAKRELLVDGDDNENDVSSC